MTKPFATYPIKAKLFFIAIASSLFAMLAALLILVVINVIDLKRKTQDDLVAVTKLIANRSVAALLFDDRNLARENLGALDKLAGLQKACIYDASGVLFAALPASQPPCDDRASNLSTHYDGLMLHVAEAIVLEGESHGGVLAVVDLTPGLWRQFRFIGLVLVVLFVALSLAFLLTAPLLNRVAMPIAALARTAQQVRKKTDFSLRARKQSDDEIGILVDAFNAMLETVEAQNRALVAVKNNYQALYDNNPTLIFSLDASGKILSVNAFGAKLLGMPVDWLQGRSLFGFIHPEDIVETRRVFRRCIENPASLQKSEGRLLCRDERVVWVNKTARLISHDNQNYDNQNYDNQNPGSQIHNNQAPHLLLVCEDVTETRRLAEKIAYQASHDELTGLVNRRQFDSLVQQLVKRTQDDGSAHVLCYLDLDQFKVVNDTGGHLAGDELLRQLGALLREQVRKTDVLARLGGDEFGILMLHCSIDQAQQAGKKLLDAVRDFQFGWDNRIYSVGVSIGLAPINRASGNAVEVLKQADAACYAAKDRGRNRLHVFTPDDEELAERQGEMQWVDQIRQGIEHNRFELFGQLIAPVKNAENGLHFETLIRYRDASGHLVPPGAFLPAAERYGIAPALDRWVIATLFEYMATTPGFVERLALVSVNLSGLSLCDETLLAFIADQLRHWHIPTRKVCFEITETAAIVNLSDAKQFIDALRKKGCRFSLDDFGSGLSSFAYLKTLPVDFLKIDGLFVKDIVEDRVDFAMVKAINEVGQIMNKKTIAEFVENDAILTILKQLGVDYAQGYGIAKPVPLRDL